MTDIQTYLDRMDITLTEYPEDPWGGDGGPMYYVTAEWREGVSLDRRERDLTLMALGRGASRDGAIASFRRSFERNLERIEENRRRAAIRKNPTSVERITL